MAHAHALKRSLSQYQRVIDFLDSYQGPFFKRSTTGTKQSSSSFPPTSTSSDSPSSFRRRRRALQPRAGSRVGRSGARSTA